MQRSTLHVTTLIIILSIISVAVQFSLFYFLGISILTFVVSGIFVLICSHIFLEHTLSYESLFSYTLLNTLVCIIVIGLSYFNEGTSFINYHPILLLFVMINLFLPVKYGTLRTLFDHGQKYNNFKSFYYNCNIFSIIIYLAIIINLLFLNNANYVIYYSNFQKINFIPFLTIATLIEDYIGGYMPLTSIVNYLLLGIVIYIPYGFYISLFLRSQRRPLKFLCLFVLPVIIEGLQIILNLGKCDIEDVILGVIGGILGGFVYFLLNSLFLIVTDEDFLYERSRYSFYRNNLHF